ncbi:NAD(P)-dependent dehydrogenase, short-chain alcohol dehydrogenase family [Roseomonas rosea]|uniref:NAD(P)-dependent dehydrogenase, short-chain alcohol dehydrogenase family n=1 Tax=Muricoccus roseus TaxID=198092 RepID=A0A1M6PTM1_9PROT|nr:SDR family oxidoreductase [Roseomonas rosea]SHK11262.1 NAD(P)-dependent dehydrogenase, short-chain alcohol dehydrogenase family [Roseomonas rosea]
MTDTKQVVLVTGAARGIGRAIAERFLRAGASVVATDVLSEGLTELEAVAPGRVATLVQDVTASPAPEEAVALAMARYGRLDVLVNNAGIGRAHAAGETDDEELDRFLDVNIRSVFRYTREALRVMEPGASIIQLASVFGYRGNAESSAYCMSKAALIGLTHQMAADYGPRGIRVNAVAPGLIVTALTQERIENSPRFRQLMVASTPFTRLGQPEDVANAAYFLASEEASFISGHVLVVDGGWLAANQRAVEA